MLRTVVLSVVLSLAGLAVVMFWLGDPEDLLGLLRVPGWAILLGLGLLLLSFLAGGARLKLLVRLTGHRIRLLRATRAHMLGLFSAAVTPGGSGNAVAIALALQRDQLRGSSAWSVTVYTSVLDLLFFAWSIPVAVYLLSRYGLTIGGPLISGLALAVGFLFLVLWYLLAFRLRWLEHLAGRVFAVPLLKRRQRATLRFLRRMTAATALMTGGTLLSHLNLQLMTAILHLSIYAIFQVVAASLGAELSLLPTLAIFLLVSVLSFAVPTPGGSGYLEFALSYLFTRQADAALVTPAVLAWRVLTYYLPIMLGPLLGGTIVAKIISGQGPSDNATSQVDELSAEQT